MLPVISEHHHEFFSNVFVFQIPIMRDPGWIRNVWSSNINVSGAAMNVLMTL